MDGSIFCRFNVIFEFSICSPDLIDVDIIHTSIETKNVHAVRLLSFALHCLLLLGCWESRNNQVEDDKSNVAKEVVTLPVTP